MTQKKRFDILLEIGVNKGDTILDFGCGLGGLYEYIIEKELKINYIGVDINENYIKDNMEHFDTNISNLFYENSVKFYTINDISDVREDFDWFMASGAFTINMDIEDIKDIIKTAYFKSNKGVAFNLLKSNNRNYITSKINNANMTLYNQHYIYNIFNEIYDNVELITGYLNNDFTIYIIQKTIN
jgi:cyclopropane fatty-acyl-phospholipid synthase-like methyltransferase